MTNEVKSSKSRHNAFRLKNKLFGRKWEIYYTEKELAKPEDKRKSKVRKVPKNWAVIELILIVKEHLNLKHWLELRFKMKCEICQNTVEIKHHISYFPEITTGVCQKCHEKIHSGEFPDLTKKYIKYKKGDANSFYEQKSRIEKITNSILRRVR